MREQESCQTSKVIYYADAKNTPQSSKVNADYSNNTLLVLTNGQPGHYSWWRHFFDNLDNVRIANSVQVAVCLEINDDVRISYIRILL